MLLHDPDFISITYMSLYSMYRHRYVPDGKQVTSAEELRSISWATFTGVLGPEVCGIWEKYTDTNDVNATDAHFKAGVIVTGDDFGLVKLLRFPSLKKGNCNIFQ